MESSRQAWSGQQQSDHEDLVNAHPEGYIVSSWFSKPASVPVLKSLFPPLVLSTGIAGTHHCTHLWLIILNWGFYHGQIHILERLNLALLRCKEKAGTLETSRGSTSVMPAAVHGDLNCRTVRVKMKIEPQ